MLLRHRRMQPLLARSVIASPVEHTVMDHHGGVRSIQAADISLPAEELEKLWSPTNLERLARTYWKYLSRISLGLFRIAYTPTERAVVLVRRPFVLLRFYAPEYQLASDRGVVRWRIRDGILVARAGREGDGYLEIDVQRCPCEEPDRAMVHVEVEIANFYPAVATWFTRFVYANTQSRIHVLVTHGFLRSLARLELEQSAVGRFAAPVDGRGPQPARDTREPISPQARVRAAHADGGGASGAGTAAGAADQEAVTVGDTPWPAILVLAGGLVAGLLLVRARR
jgi:hypothetical protein